MPLAPEASATGGYRLPPSQRLHVRANWTDSEAEQLIKDWNDGVSSGKLAARYGRTRSSVVGMVKRLRGSGVRMRVANPQDTCDVRRSNVGNRKAAKEVKRPTAHRTPLKVKRRKQPSAGASFQATKTQTLGALPAIAAEEIVRLRGKGKVLAEL